MVITDWLMPGLNGDDLCRRIRNAPTTPYTYVVLLTSLDHKAHLLGAMEAGADAEARERAEKLDGQELAAVAAERHPGTLTSETDSPARTTFHLRLPIEEDR